MKLFFATLLLTIAGDVWAACIISQSDGSPSPRRRDSLSQILTAQAECPQNVVSFRQLLHNMGLKTEATMVANRGFHDHRSGSYSFFEMASGVPLSSRQPVKKGQFYFGHFTARSNSQLVLNQSPSRGNLMIELIVWDPSYKAFNFYELIGNGSGGTWFYRGNSFDILKDNMTLKLQPKPGQPVFGQRLRCSGCHTSGGPIMKELKAPHNDWWRNGRPLKLSQFSLSNNVSEIMKTVKDASSLAKATRDGIHALANSPAYNAAKKKSGFRQMLKPLFCTTEVNLESSQVPSESSAQWMAVPSAAFVSPLLAPSKALKANRAIYRQTLTQLGAQFPGTNKRDGDHGWLVPVKAYADVHSIQQLVAQKVITAEFAADVLAVDMKRPLFSSSRCNLLKLVPNASLSDWGQELMQNLKKVNSAGSKQLLRHLTDKKFSRAAHARRAMQHLQSVEANLQSSAGMQKAVGHLYQLRMSVFQDEISKNPRGQIFEPGFRVIFPTLNN